MNGNIVEEIQENVSVEHEQKAVQGRRMNVIWRVWPNLSEHPRTIKLLKNRVTAVLNEIRLPPTNVRVHIVGVAGKSAKRESFIKTGKKMENLSYA